MDATKKQSQTNHYVNKALKPLNDKIKAQQQQIENLKKFLQKKQKTIDDLKQDNYDLKLKLNQTEKVEG